MDAALSAQAIEIVTPLVEQAMRDPAYGDSGFLHIVVLGEDGATLFEHSFGDRARWDADYAAFAHEKATRSLARRADDEQGAAWLDGVAVGVSGAFPCFDHAYAGTVAMWLRALARRRAELAA